MKERPILFSGPMVRALLNGSKTQTRRIVKFPFRDSVERDILWDQELLEKRKRQWDDDVWLRDIGACCPYGQPGDRLWVRETWNTQTIDGVERVAYRADIPNGYSFIGWRPSIFMPRALSRITLEITGVRVERVQDISEADASAEGVQVTPGHLSRPIGSMEPPTPYTHRQSYAALWDSINAERAPWSSNPWVWAVEFRRV